MDGETEQGTGYSERDENKVGKGALRSAMIRLIFECEDTAPVEQIREHLEMYLERWHDFRLVRVERAETEQMKIGGRYDARQDPV